MVYFDVPDMYSCRSVGAISKSVKSFDQEATVVVDMVEHLVAIDSERLAPDALQRVIGAAGFTPVPRTGMPAVDVLLPLDDPASAP